MIPDLEGAARIVARSLGAEVTEFRASLNAEYLVIGLRCGSLETQVSLSEVELREARFPAMALAAAMRARLAGAEFEAAIIASMTRQEGIRVDCDLPAAVSGFGDPDPCARYPSRLPRGVAPEDLAVFDAVSLEPPEVDFINRAVGDW